jgi:hypothetical protein
LCQLAQRILDLQAADPGDGAAQPYQGLAVQRIRSPEGMDDLGRGLAALGMAHVMGELVVDDLAAVAILAPSGPKVHAH